MKLSKYIKLKDILLTLFVLTVIMSPASAGLNIQIPEWFTDTLGLTYIGPSGDVEYSQPQVLDYNGNVIDAGKMDGYDEGYGYFESYSNSYVELWQHDTFTQTDIMYGKMYISLELKDLNPGNGQTDFSNIIARVYKDGGVTFDDIYFTTSDTGIAGWVTKTTPNDYSYYDSAGNGWVKVRLYHSSLNPDRVAVFDIKYGVHFITGTPIPTPISTPYPTPTPTATPPTSLPPDDTPSATATATTTPTNALPVARIAYEDMGNGKMVLRGTDSTDSDGTIEEYLWHLNDQYINGQSTFTHVFDEAGTYTIRLDVVDNDGGSSSATLMISIKESDNSAGVVIGDVDDTQSTSSPAAGTSGEKQDYKGIWIEDGALKVPGFEALFAICGIVVVFWYVRRG